MIEPESDSDGWVGYAPSDAVPVEPPAGLWQAPPLVQVTCSDGRLAVGGVTADEDRLWLWEELAGSRWATELSMPLQRYRRLWGDGRRVLAVAGVLRPWHPASVTTVHIVLDGRSHVPRINANAWIAVLPFPGPAETGVVEWLDDRGRVYRSRALTSKGL